MRCVFVGFFGHDALSSVADAQGEAFVSNNCGDSFLAHAKARQRARPRWPEGEKGKWAR